MTPTQLLVPSTCPNMEQEWIEGESESLLWIFPWPSSCLQISQRKEAGPHKPLRVPKFINNENCKNGTVRMLKALRSLAPRTACLESKRRTVIAVPVVEVGQLWQTGEKMSLGSTSTSVPEVKLSGCPWGSHIQMPSSACRWGTTTERTSFQDQSHHADSILYSLFLSCKKRA